VRSSSPLEPFKKDGFSEENKSFAGKTSYSEWQFVFDITSVKKQPAGKTPAQNPPATQTQ
jgi:hypothetical protein